MKLGTIINNIIKSEENEEDWFSLDNLANSAGVSHSDGLPNSEDTDFTCYWFTQWRCTDTLVGGRVYFLRDKVVAASWQEGSKCEEFIEFVSTEAVEEVRKYLYSLLQEEDHLSPSIMKLDEEFRDTRVLNWSSQYIKGLHKNPVHKPTGEVVDVVKVYNHYLDHQIFRDKVLICFRESGTIKSCDISDLEFPLFVEEK